MKAKYIIVKNRFDETPYVFPETVNHTNIAVLITRNNIEKVVSAGFCDVGYDEKLSHNTWSCWGKSVSLELESRREKDEEILNRMFNVNPY